MLSDEEKKAIERAEFLIKIDTYLEKEMLTNLLNLIEKQSKEIEELKKYEEGYKLLSYCLDNYTSNDKIKAKIEEYDDKGITVNLANRSAGRTFQQAVRTEVKNILQSLLEKE